MNVEFTKTKRGKGGTHYDSTLESWQKLASDATVCFLSFRLHLFYRFYCMSVTTIPTFGKVVLAKYDERMKSLHPSRRLTCD